MIALGFATQGLGYATVMTALPTFKNRFKLSGRPTFNHYFRCLYHSSTRFCFGRSPCGKTRFKICHRDSFYFEAIGIAVAAFSSSVTVMVASFILYGLGLGCLDAALNMQAVMMEQRLGKSALGGFFACYTAAAFLGAMTVSATVSTSFMLTTALFIAVTIALMTALSSKNGFFNREKMLLLSQKPKNPIPQNDYGFLV